MFALTQIDLSAGSPATFPRLPGTRVQIFVDSFSSLRYLPLRARLHQNGWGMGEMLRHPFAGFLRLAQMNR